MDISDLHLHDGGASNDSSGSPSHVPDDYEVTFYYSGISNSPPDLVYRTSKTPFVPPTGPEAYRRLKYLCPVYDHKLGDKWEEIGPKIRDLLDKQQIRFSTIDVVRFRTVSDEETPPPISPVVIWIGVLPDTLTGKEACTSANAILALLKDEDITDVDVEFRESVFRRSAGAKLYRPASDFDASRHIIDPLTTALGLPIAAAKTPDLEGTMGFYFKDGDDLYGVTARHVIFPADEDNSDYTYDSSKPRKDVLLMGTKAWSDYRKSVETEVRSFGLMAEGYRESIERLEARAEGDTPAPERAKEELKHVRRLLKEATDAMKELPELYEQTKQDFGQPSQRVIGHVVWSPAITAGTAPHGFTKDICVVKLEKERFLPNFKGNVIDLGTQIEPSKFVMKMDPGRFKMLYIDPEPETMHPREDVRPSFKYPFDRLFELRGILTEDHMRHPDTRNYDGEKCLYVIKHGTATLTTIGRATGLFSYTREYFANQTHQDSKHWAILGHDYESGAYHHSGPFSEAGDSGSMVAPGTGEFGGLLTGGCGATESSDITYATPMFWLWPVIKAEFPNADLHPVFD